MSKRFEVHVLVNAGSPGVGEFAPTPKYFATEAEALREVEELREDDRYAMGWARTYRVVEKPALSARRTA